MPANQPSENPVNIALASVDEGATPKHRQILQGARQIFLRDGFDGASMSAITQAAGVSKSTIYSHFRSKALLFEALIREERRVQMQQVFNSDAFTGDLHEDLLQLATGIIHVILSPTALAHLRIVIAIATKFPNIGAAFFEAGPGAGRERLSALLASLHARGDLNITEPAMAANHFIGLCRSDLLMHALLTPNLEISAAYIEQTARSGVDVFLRAYRRGP